MAEILAVLPTHGLINLTKFDEDQAKIVDLLLVAYFQSSIFFLISLYEQEIANIILWQRSRKRFLTMI